MKLDYALMRDILENLMEVYPNRRDIPFWAQAKIQDERLLVQHITYLAQHGMIESRITTLRGGNNFKVAPGRITEKGIDFLQADGGLSALAAPMIRISPQSFAVLIEAALAKSEASQEEQSMIRKSLAEAGPEAMRGIVQRILDAAVSRIPNIASMFTS